MSELKMISPLLDGMTVEKQGPSYDGRTYYTLRDRSTGEQLMLKVLSVPSSDSHVRALILSGAYPDEAAVNEYYRRYTIDISRELKLGKELTEAGFFAGALDFQVVPRESEVGFDIYILLRRHIPLTYLLNENAITGLRAINLGIDICDALISCREAGLLFTNLTPDSIYLTPNGKFLLGDLGLIELEELEYSSVPEEYIGPYSAPELSDINESPNTTIDLYSLGMVLFRIYNGNHGPYEDENTGEGMADKLRLSGKPLPTPIYADYELAGIIQKACAFQKEERFQTPEELKQALVLYMQRNQITDNLIVPPIVVNFTPPVDLPEEEEEEEAPVRMTKEESLDETFRKSFSPDLSGAGSDASPAPLAESPEEPPAKAAEPEVEPKDEAEPEPAATEPEAVEEPQAASFEAAPEEEEFEEESLLIPPVSASFESPEATELTDALVDVINSTEQESEKERDHDSFFADLLSSASEEEGDPDQIDIDSLLASLSDVIGDQEETQEEASPEPAAEEAEPEAEEAAPAQEESREEGLRLRFEEPTLLRQDKANSPEEVPAEDVSEKKPFKLLPIAIIAALLLAIGLVVFFLIRWYFVEAAALNVTSLTTDELVVQIVSEDPVDRFTVSCTDSHGNRYYGTQVADQFRFTGLSETTTYTLTIEAAGMHKLNDASVKTHTVTTPEATHITKIDASRGDTDGSVLITFYHEGPTPEDWLLSYSNESGSISDSITFDGNAYMLQDLPVGENYTFSLEQTQGIFIKDAYTVSYELLPIIVASDLKVDGISGNVISLSWSSTANDPGQWLVGCEAEGADPILITTEQTTCELTLPDLTKDYIISVSAAGMDEPLNLVLPANPIVVENFTVTVDEDGMARVSWETPAGTPDGGWYLSYNTIGSLHPDYMLGGESAPIEGNTVQIPYLIPEAEYRFALNLTAADASRQIFGVTELNYSTAEAEPLRDFGISPNAPIDGSENLVTLYPLPDYSGWNYTNLYNRSTKYDADDKIAVCVELLFQPFSEEEVHLCYAVRNSQGQVVSDVSDTVVWDDMWYRRRHASAIPMPVGEDGSNVLGEYTLEIYVNGKLFALIDFTIE